MAEFLMKMAAKEILGALDTEQAKAMQVFEKLSQKLQYSETGGAPLLGIDGVCIICHGSSDDRSISNAMKMATTLKSKEINSKITAELARTVTSA
jgi:glycerol-3-phosphate acyltransferase PlsX